MGVSQTCLQVSALPLALPTILQQDLFQAFLQFRPFARHNTSCSISRAIPWSCLSMGQGQGGWMCFPSTSNLLSLNITSLHQLSYSLPQEKHLLMPCPLEVSTRAWRLQCWRMQPGPAPTYLLAWSQSRAHGSGWTIPAATSGWRVFSHHPLMWLCSEPTADGLPIQSANMGILPAVSSYLLLLEKGKGPPKPPTEGLGFLQLLLFTMDTEMKPEWARLSGRWLWTGLWLFYKDQSPHFPQLQFTPSEPSVLWFLQTKLPATLRAEMTFLTTLFLQVVPFMQTGVLTSSVWTGKITSAAQWSFHFPQ